MIKKLRIICGWFFSGTCLLGFLIGIKMFFTEPVMSAKFGGIVIAVTNLAIAYVFYIIGPGWEVFLEKRKLKAMKREEEAKQKEEKRKEEAKQEEAKQKEEKRKEEAKQKEEKREEEAKQKEEKRKEEAKQKEEKRKEEAKQKEEKREEEAKQKEEKRKEEEAKQKQRERRAKEEEARQKKLERRAKEEEKLRELCLDENEWKSFKENKICVGMHILVVQDIKGKKHDEKRNVSANKTTLKYKYGQSLNQKDNWSYELEVTFVDDRVTAFKDL